MCIQSRVPTVPLPETAVHLCQQEVNTVNGTATVIRCIHFHCIRMRAVSIMCSSTQVTVDITFYWTDPRLVGYDYQTLPSKLWGPRLELQGVVGTEITETQVAFQRLETGRFFSKSDMACKAAAAFGCDFPRMDFADANDADPLEWPESGRMMRRMQYTAVSQRFSQCPSL